MHAFFTPVINKYLKSPNHEIELRLGKLKRGKFDTNIGFESYKRALSSLQQYTGWENIKVSNDTIYYGAGGRRATMNEESEEVTRIIKKRVEVQDFQMIDAPFDVRLGICTETPYEEIADEEVFEETRQRVRHSFVRKNLSIDLSFIKGTPDDMDAESDLSYQLEMEIVDPAAVGSDVELYNILYKVFDVLKVL